MTFRFKQKKTDHPVRNSSPVSDYAKQHDGVPKRGGLVRQESQHSLPEIDITPTTPSEHSYKKDKHGYFVKLSLHSGHNLAIRDRSGTSDPYVKIKHKNYKVRSSVVYRNLNPVWNEDFGFKVRDLSDPILLKVYDKDSVTSDDFMGWGQIPLNDANMGSMIPLQITLSDRKGREANLGYLQLSVGVTLINDDNEYSLHATDNVPVDQKQIGKKSIHKSWKSIASITLLEGRGLPAMDQNGFSDPYCKFRLGSQKYRSNVKHKTLNPEWKEHFEMKIYEGESKMLYINVMDRDYLSSDDFIGSCKVDLGDYQVQRQHNIILPLQDSPGTIHLLLVISGIPAQEGEEEAMKCASELYHIKKSLNFNHLEDVGILKVTVLRADGFRVSSNQYNPFCTVEVGQARLRTNTLYSQSNPNWNKTFYFHVKDIHSSIHVVLYNDTKNKDEQLGRIIIPLLRVESGVTKDYQLKDKDCLQPSPTGSTIVINCNLIYNSLRAAVRTVNPKEAPVFEHEQQFQQKILRNNVTRILVFVRPLMRLLQFIESILSWKDKVLSSLAIVVFMIVCYFIELWMVFVIGILVVVGFYISVFVFRSQQVTDNSLGMRKRSSFHDSESDLSDYEDPIVYDMEAKEGKKGLREKLRQVMSVLLLVQIYTGYVADGCERLKNMLRWSVPFLCCMIVIACVIASLVTYFIPLRYIIMLWGLNKLTKKLRKPNAIPNNELLDFLSRSPTDLELAKWKELTHRPTGI